MSLSPAHPSVQRAIEQLKGSLDQKKVAAAVVMSLEHDLALRIAFKFHPKGGVRVTFQFDDRGT